MKYPEYPAYLPATEAGIRYPASWRLQRLRFAIHSNPVRSEVSNWLPDTPVSFVPMEAIGETGQMVVGQERPIGEVYNGFTYFADGDVIVAKITPCFENGKGALAAGLINRVGFGTTELHVMRALPDVVPRWLFYLTQAHTFRKLGEAEMYGAGGQKRVPEDFIKDHRIALPGLEEQGHIANFLDWKTGQIDALLGKKQALISRVNEARQVAITQAVTAGFDWPRRRVRTFMLFLTSGSRGWAEFFADTGPLFFRIANVQRNSVSLLLDDLQRVNPPESTEGLRTKTRPGDLLISITADLGSVAVVPEGLEAAYVSQHLALLRVDEQQVNPRWVAYSVLSSYGRHQLQASGYGGTKVQLGLDDIKNFAVLLPPTLAEQEQRLMWLDQELTRLDRLLARVSAAVAKLNEYRSALITAAVTGQIDVRGVAVPPPA